MLQLKNQSPFCPSINLFANEDGIDTLYITVKATFDIQDKVTLADEQVPPQVEDEYFAEPLISSLKYASEIHLGKVATDIIVNGHAYAPQGRPTSSFDCGIKIGNYSKTVRVFGDRYWRGEQISSPDVIKKIPLIFEHAYGGYYLENSDNREGNSEPKKILHTGNPLGRGYRKKGSKASDGEMLPNFENLKNLIKSPEDQPEPMGFGFIAPTWTPRADYAGTYDENWQKTRAPYLPKDFNKKFFSAAAAELIVNDYLKGGEEVIIVNLAEQPRIQFDLPECQLTCEINVAGAKETPELKLETVLVEPDDQRFYMTWRGEFQCDKKALKIKEIVLKGDWTERAKVFMV